MPNDPYVKVKTAKEKFETIRNNVNAMLEREQSSNLERDKKLKAALDKKYNDY